MILGRANSAINPIMLLAGEGAGTGANIFYNIGIDVPALLRKGCTFRQSPPATHRIGEEGVASAGDSEKNAALS